MRPRTLKSAAEYGDLDAVEYHLSRGADINATTAAGHFALGGAIIHDHPDVVEYLIAHGADIELRSEYGWSPLYIAAWAGSAESVALLLSAGAKLNTRTIGGWNSPSGFTPLHIAASAGHLAIVMLLVASGADVNALTGSSQTALDRAIENDHPHVVKYLKGLARSNAPQADAKKRHGAESVGDKAKSPPASSGGQKPAESATKPPVKLSEVPGILGKLKDDTRTAKLPDGQRIRLSDVAPPYGGTKDKPTLQSVVRQDPYDPDSPIIGKVPIPASWVRAWAESKPLPRKPTAGPPKRKPAAKR